MLCHLYFLDQREVLLLERMVARRLKTADRRYL